MFKNLKKKKKNISLLHYYKFHAGHLPLVQKLALSVVLHSLHEFFRPVLSNLGMFLQLLLHKLVVEHCIAVNEVVALLAYAHEIEGIICAVHTGGHDVVHLHGLQG